MRHIRSTWEATALLHLLLSLLGQGAFAQASGVCDGLQVLENAEGSELYTVQEQLSTSAAAHEEATLAERLLDVDGVDADEGSFSLQCNPQKGSVLPPGTSSSRSTAQNAIHKGNGSFVYTPRPGFPTRANFTEDVFTFAYRVSGNRRLKNCAIRILRVNKPPPDSVAALQSFTGTSDYVGTNNKTLDAPTVCSEEAENESSGRSSCLRAKLRPKSAADADGDSLVYRIVRAPSNGTVFFPNGQSGFGAVSDVNTADFRYVPLPGISDGKRDSFDYEVTDCDAANKPVLANTLFNASTDNQLSASSSEKSDIDRLSCLSRIGRVQVQIGESRGIPSLYASYTSVDTAKSLASTSNLTVAINRGAYTDSGDLAYSASISGGGIPEETFDLSALGSVTLDAQRDSEIGPNENNNLTFVPSSRYTFTLRKQPAAITVKLAKARSASSAALDSQRRLLQTEEASERVYVDIDHPNYAPIIDTFPEQSQVPYIPTTNQTAQLSRILGSSEGRDAGNIGRENYTVLHITAIDDKKGNNSNGKDGKDNRVWLKFNPMSLESLPGSLFSELDRLANEVDESSKVGNGGSLVLMDNRTTEPQSMEYKEFRDRHEKRMYFRAHAGVRGNPIGYLRFKTTDGEEESDEKSIELRVACAPGFRQANSTDSAETSNVLVDGVQNAPTCAICQPGYVAEGTDSKQCTACSPGSVAPNNGQTTCTLCGLDTYQDEEGQAVCKLCPYNRNLKNSNASETSKTKSEGADNIFDCICRSRDPNKAPDAGLFGYYGNAGESCWPCHGPLSKPDGFGEVRKGDAYAVCDEDGQTLPKSKQGHYVNACHRVLNNDTEEVGLEECMPSDSCYDLEDVTPLDVANETELTIDESAPNGKFMQTMGAPVSLPMLNRVVILLADTIGLSTKDGINTTYAMSSALDCPVPLYTGDGVMKSSADAASLAQEPVPFNAFTQLVSMDATAKATVSLLNETETPELSDGNRSRLARLISCVLVSDDVYVPAYEEKIGPDSVSTDTNTPMNEQLVDGILPQEEVEKLFSYARLQEDAQSQNDLGLSTLALDVTTSAEAALALDSGERVNSTHTSVETMKETSKAHSTSGHSESIDEQLSTLLSGLKSLRRNEKAFETVTKVEEEPKISNRTMVSQQLLRLTANDFCVQRGVNENTTYECRSLFLCVPCAEKRGVDGPCRRGYTGPGCKECQEGFYRIEGTCNECPQNSDVEFTIVISVLALFFTPVLFKFSNNIDFTGFAKLVGFMQLYNVLGAQLTWPANLKRWLDSLAFFSFNLQLVHPECSINNWTFFSRWAVGTSLPLIAGGAAVTVLSIAYAHSWLAANVFLPLTTRHQWLITPPTAGSMFGPLIAAKRQLFVFLRLGFSRDMLIMLTHLAIRGLTSFLHILYVPLASNGFELFNCGKDELTGAWHLESEPSVVCYSGPGSENWQGVLPFAILSLIAYPIGINVLFIFMLYRARHDLNHHAVQDTLGWMFDRFQPRYFWYEVVIMARKVIVVGNLMLIAGSSTSGQLRKAAISMLVTLTGLLLQFHIAPYRSVHLDRVECVGLLTEFYTVFVSVILQSDKPDSQFRQSIETASFFVWGISYAVMMLYIMLDIFPDIDESIQTAKDTLEAFKKKQATKKEIASRRATGVKQGIVSWWNQTSRPFMDIHGLSEVVMSPVKLALPSGTWRFLTIKGQLYAFHLSLEDRRNRLARELKVDESELISKQKLHECLRAIDDHIRGHRELFYPTQRPFNLEEELREDTRDAVLEGLATMDREGNLEMLNELARIYRAERARRNVVDEQGKTYDEFAEAMRYFRRSKDTSQETGKDTPQRGLAVRQPKQVAEGAEEITSSDSHGEGGRGSGQQPVATTSGAAAAQPPHAAPVEEQFEEQAESQ